jgi:hypothetical protein
MTSPVSSVQPPWRSGRRSQRGGLELLDAEIERLQLARTWLEAALLCRFDHPATDCRIMGAEIDRRLADAPRAARRREGDSRRQYPAGRATSMAIGRLGPLRPNPC